MTFEDIGLEFGNRDHSTIMNACIKIEKLMNDGKIQWVYVCGLGEPTAPANLRHLKQIIPKLI